MTLQYTDKLRRIVDFKEISRYSEDLFHSLTDDVKYEIAAHVWHEIKMSNSVNEAGGLATTVHLIRYAED